MPQEKAGVEHCPRRLPEVEMGEVGEAIPRGKACHKGDEVEVMTLEAYPQVL